MTQPDHTSDLAHHRALWSIVNRGFTGSDADSMWSAEHFSWGLFRHPESDLQVLGDVNGLDVLELGCGTAYVSAWLAGRGASVVALDLSHDQLMTAARCQQRHGPRFPLVEADGERVPLGDGCFDLVVSEYGAAPWCDPAQWLREAARVLRPRGRLVFLTNSVLSALCVPAEGGPAGERLLRSMNELSPVRWPGGGLEHHPGHGAWIAMLRSAGFVVESLHELSPPSGAQDHEYYEIVGADWAGRWPAEDLWSARLAV